MRRATIAALLLAVVAVGDVASASSIDSGAMATQRAVRGTQVRVVSLPDCPDAPRGAVVDKAAQRFWLCTNGRPVTGKLRMTSGSELYGLPPIGTHHVFSKDLVAGGLGGTTLERFVSFYRTSRGNRIGFHKYVNQDPTTIGDLDQRGASAGCLRVTVADSWTVWNHLQIGDPVKVITP